MRSATRVAGLRPGFLGLHRYNYGPGAAGQPRHADNLGLNIVSKRRISFVSKHSEKAQDRLRINQSTTRSMVLAVVCLPLACAPPPVPQLLPPGFRDIQRINLQHFGTSLLQRG